MIAARIGQDTSFPSLEIATEDHSSELGSCGGDYACAYMNTISWRNPTTPNPMELNPRVVFERMFGGNGATAEQRAARLKDNLSLLDGVTASAKDLAKSMDARDRARLTDYLDNVREIERRIATVSHDILPALIAGGAAGRLKGNLCVKAPLMTPFSNLASAFN